MKAPSDVVIRLADATVEIPLRGVRSTELLSDPRIVRRARGKIVLRVLSGISLEVRRGERIGIVGGNGNGKTTLLKLIGGMLPTASGRVEVRGSIRALLSIGAGTIPSLTGRQNVCLRYDLLGIRSVSLEAYTDDVASFSELGDFFDLPVGTYSPGMQSRLQFAMSTVEPADILLLDEWMGVADRDFQQKAHDRLVKFIGLNDGFIFATHNEQLLNEMTDRRLVLHQGRLLEHA